MYSTFYSVYVSHSEAHPNSKQNSAKAELISKCEYKFNTQKISLKIGNQLLLDLNFLCIYYIIISFVHNYLYYFCS